MTLWAGCNRSVLSPRQGKPVSHLCSPLHMASQELDSMMLSSFLTFVSRPFLLVAAFSVVQSKKLHFFGSFAFFPATRYTHLYNTPMTKHLIPIDIRSLP